MRLLAPAKINLHLRVGPRRNDGFHPLVSWMCTVGLFDTLTLERTRSTGFELVSEGLPVACDSTNLVARAAALWSEALATPPRENVAATDLSAAAGIRAVLHKQIPIGAGLGGGSSDAARTLLGLNELLGDSAGGGLSRERLAAVAARLGSDVPFFLHGPSSICRGRGEIVQPLAPPAVARWALLVLPAMHVSTAQVYGHFDRLNLGSNLDEPADFSAWPGLPARELLTRLVNDLEAATFALLPELGRLRGDLEQDLAQIVRMSGSGSSLFTLFDDPGAARAAAERVGKRFNVSAIAVELAPTVQDDLSR